MSETRETRETSWRDEARARVAGALRAVRDFPRPGVTFQDVAPALADAEAFAAAVALMREAATDLGATQVLGVDARGFALGAAVARDAGTGLLLARKPGKLPVVGARRGYTLEYGEAALELAPDGVAGERVVVVDDVLATGGTAEAAGWLVRALGGEVAGYAFLLEVPGLGGRARLAGSPVSVAVPEAGGGR